MASYQKSLRIFYKSFSQKMSCAVVMFKMHNNSRPNMDFKCMLRCECMILHLSFPSLNIVQKKMTMCKNYESLLHQKRRFFITSKGVDVSLGIWRSRKAIKSLLQNIYLIWELLYHKLNPLVTTVVNGSIFLKIFKTITSEKNARRIMKLK